MVDGNAGRANMVVHTRDGGTACFPGFLRDRVRLSRRRSSIHLPIWAKIIPGFSPADVLDPICRRKTGTVRTAFGFVRGKKEGFSEVTGKEV